MCGLIKELNMKKEIKALHNLDRIKKIYFNNKIILKIKILFNKVKYIKIIVAYYLKALIKIIMILNYKFKKNKIIDILCYRYFQC